MIGTYLLLLSMILLWSFSFIIVDIAVMFIPPLSVALYRFIIASLSFFVIDIIQKVKKPIRTSENFAGKSADHYNKLDWLLLFFASLTGVSLFFFTQYNAINLIGPSLPALFVCLLSPVLISLLALIFFEERLHHYKISGFIIATLGGFLLVTGGNISVLTPSSPNFLGYIFALLTPILWSLYSTITKQIKNKDNLTMLKYISYFGTIELCIIILFSGELPIFIRNLFNPLLFLCSIYLGIGCYVVGYLIWQLSQKKMESSKVASFLYIEPFLTLGFSFLLQRNEVIVIWNLIGGLIVLIGVLLLNYKKTSKES
ncbi:MAG: putative amino-acid metabolite efflux pump [Promethearchaeota archaeon]|nr:MAG: putative amino-acid metabolite efflux pump [Candidatus Lokiarchaeota archaeon]